MSLRNGTTFALQVGMKMHISVGLLALVACSQQSTQAGEGGAAGGGIPDHLGCSHDPEEEGDCMTCDGILYGPTCVDGEWVCVGDHGCGGGGYGAGGHPEGGHEEETVDQCDLPAWNAIDKGDIACNTNSDCCVVANGCIAEVYLVHSSALALAKAAWGNSCDPYGEGCAACIAPKVSVACVAGTCQGVELDFDSSETPAECGTNLVWGDGEGGAGPTSNVGFSCGGPLDL